MTMPIGALKKASAGMSNPQDAAGLYYQWGRKDPMGRPKDFTTTSGNGIFDVKGPDQTTALNLGDSDYSISGGNLRNCMIWFANSSIAERNTLKDAYNQSDKSKSQGRFMIDYTVSKPWMYIMCNDDSFHNNWTKQDDWLWGNGYSSASFHLMDETYKSIFDPSPEGFRVAPQDLWIVFTKSHGHADGSSLSGGELDTFISDNFNVASNTFQNGNNANGWSFYYQGWRGSEPGKTAFYLASGVRVRNGGTIGDVGNNGYTWASAPDGISGSYLFFVSKRVTPYAANGRAYGFPGRCVPEP